tara:strand:+ start:58 stop:516 length:459 start_codon:yes stop_codon:yes gene_type:complete
MAPSLRPQQQLYEVVKLPELPKNLDPKIEIDQPLLKNPPKASPRKITFVGSVEWAWSPAHGRIDNYYINPRRTGWLLWNNWVEDGGAPWTWHWDLMAYGNRCQSDEKTITIHLLQAVWKFDEKYHDVEHFHWVNNTGLLDIEELEAIAREVW